MFQALISHTFVSVISERLGIKAIELKAEQQVVKTISTYQARKEGF